MSSDDKLSPYRCGCGHLMAQHERDLGACQMLGCDCPHWVGWGSDAHMRRTPRIAIDLKGPRTALAGLPVIADPEAPRNEIRIVDPATAERLATIRLAPDPGVHP